MDYWVDHLDGSDEENDGTSYKEAFKTIAHALAIIDKSDHIKMVSKIERVNHAEETGKVSEESEVAQ